MRAIIEDENADDGVKLRVSVARRTAVDALHCSVLVLAYFDVLICSHTARNTVSPARKRKVVLHLKMRNQKERRERT
jgi:hypothetical protein